MALTETSTTLIDEALRRISVTPPYFALQELATTPTGLVTARVPSAPPSGPERGAIEAGQAARHLAILGSCAAALAREDDQKLHYLATKAHYSRTPGTPAPTGGEPLIAEAFATWIDKRTARALITLSTAAGAELTRLDVTYAVIAPKVFERLHQPSAFELPIPQVTHGLLDAPVLRTADGVRMVCGPVPAALCAGHFPDYPAAPIAIVMGQLCKTAGYALAHELGIEARYRIEEGDVEATKLAMAGQQLVLDASYLMGLDEHHVLLGTARADGEVIGEVRVTMTVPTD